MVILVSQRKLAPHVITQTTKKASLITNAFIFITLYNFLWVDLSTKYQIFRRDKVIGLALPAKRTHYKWEPAFERKQYINAYEVGMLCGDCSNPFTALNYA